MKKLLLFLFFPVVLLGQTSTTRMNSGSNVITSFPYTVLASDVTKIDVFQPSANSFVIFPVAGSAGFEAGKVFSIKNDSNNYTITLSSTSYISGQLSITLATEQGADIYSTGTTYEIQPGAGNGGGIPGGSTLSTQYNNAGAFGGAPNGISGQIYGSTNNSAPAFVSPGLSDSANSPVTASTYTIACDTGTTIVDRAHLLRFQSGAATVTVPLSTGSGCPGLVTTVIDESAGTLTFNATSPDVINIYNGSTASLNQSSFQLTINGQSATISQSSSGLWEVRIPGGGGSPILTNAIVVNGTEIPTFWDTKQISTANWSNSSSTITSSVAAFSPTDCVGGSGCTGTGSSKNVYGFLTCDTGTIQNNQAAIVPWGTITSYTSSTQIGISTTTTAASGSDSGCLYWGHPDDTALSSADTAAAASAVCPHIQLPVGMGMVTEAHFITSIASCANSPQGLGGSIEGWGEVIQGYGKGATVVALAPTLASANSSTCTGGADSIACFGGQQGQVFRDFSFNGGGNCATGFGSAVSVFELGSYSAALNWEFDNFGCSDSHAKVTLYGIGTGDFEFVDLVGSPQVVTVGGGVYNITHSSMQEVCGSLTVLAVNSIVNSANNFYSIGPCGSVFQNAVNVTGSGLFNSNGDYFFTESNASQLNLINVSASGGRANLSNGAVVVSGSNVSGLPIDLATSGALLYLQNMKLVKGTSQTYDIYGVSGTSVYDLGGNTCSGGACTSTTVAGGLSVFGAGSITGTALASGDLAASANFGSGAAFSAITGSTKNFTFTLTNGSSSVGSNPTITITFPVPFWATPSRCTLWQVGGTQAVTATTAILNSTSISSTAVTFTYPATPSTSDTEFYQGSCDQ